MGTPLDSRLDNRQDSQGAAACLHFLSLA